MQGVLSSIGERADIYIRGNVSRMVHVPNNRPLHPFTVPCELCAHSLSMLIMNYQLLRTLAVELTSPLIHVCAYTCLHTCREEGMETVGSKGNEM